MQKQVLLSNESVELRTIIACRAHISRGLVCFGLDGAYRQVSVTRPLQITTTSTRWRSCGFFEQPEVLLGVQVLSEFGQGQVIEKVRRSGPSGKHLRRVFTMSRKLADLTERALDLPA